MSDREVWIPSPARPCRARPLRQENTLCSDRWCGFQNGVGKPMRTKAASVALFADTRDWTGADDLDCAWRRRTIRHRPCASASTPMGSLTTRVHAGMVTYLIHVDAPSTSSTVGATRSLTRKPLVRPRSCLVSVAEAVYTSTVLVHGTLVCCSAFSWLSPFLEKQAQDPCADCCTRISYLHGPECDGCCMGAARSPHRLTPGL